MAITLDPATLQFTVLQADLTFVSGTLYELDSDAFRKECMSLLASEAYIYLPNPYIHNTEVTVAGTTFARTLEFVNGFSIKFEDTGGQYSVRITGSNNNIFDVENGILVPTSLVTVIPTNSAGLIVNETSGLNAAQQLQVDQIHGQIRRCVFLNSEAVTNGDGYQQTPWNNWSDAVDDAEALGLQKIEIEADTTLDRNLSNFTVVGINLPTIDLAGFDMKNAIFSEVTLTGAQGTGNSPLLALTCNIIAITDFNGSMLTVSVVTSISIADGAVCLINEVVPAVGGVPWTLDMGAGGAASTVQIQNISGGMTITNMDNASDSAHFAFDQGAITIDATCTAGTIVISGGAKLTDNSGAGCTVDKTALIDTNYVNKKLLTVSKFIGLK